MTADPLARPVRDYRDIEALLLSRVRDDPRPYSSRGPLAGRALRELLDRCAVSLEGLCFLHVAGSKGKGSVALLAEHLLLDLAEPTGCFTSPHLRRWNERIRVQGAPVDDRLLADTLERLRPHVAAMDARGDELAPTFFDLVTAAGLAVFAAGDVRTVVLETGLGGRFDASNIVTPAACCITSIELEHTDKLGDSLAQIAWHKAGIIKSGAPVVAGELPPEATAAVAARVAEVDTRELRLHRDWSVDCRVRDDGAQDVEVRSDLLPGGGRFSLPSPGRHAAVNAALALLLVNAAGFAPDAAALARCRLPGRGEFLSRRPWILVDAAHTPASLQALGLLLSAVPARQRRFLVSATLGKPAGALAALLGSAQQVVVTRADALRSAPAALLAEALHAADPALPLEVVDDPSTALARARADLPPDALLCVCGSVYLAGFALEELEQGMDPF